MPILTGPSTSWLTGFVSVLHLRGDVPTVLMERNIFTIPPCQHLEPQVVNKLTSLLCQLDAFLKHHGFTLTPQQITLLLRDYHQAFRDVSSNSGILVNDQFGKAFGFLLSSDLGGILVDTNTFVIPFIGYSFSTHREPPTKADFVAKSAIRHLDSNGKGETTNGFDDSATPTTLDYLSRHLSHQRTDFRDTASIPLEEEGESEKIAATSPTETGNWTVTLASNRLVETLFDGFPLLKPSWNSTLGFITFNSIRKVSSIDDPFLVPDGEFVFDRGR